MNHPPGTLLAQIHGKVVPLDQKNTRHFCGVAAGPYTIMRAGTTTSLNFVAPWDVAVSDRVYLALGGGGFVNTRKNGRSIGIVVDVRTGTPGGRPRWFITVEIDPAVRNWKVPREHYFTGRKK